MSRTIGFDLDMTLIDSRPGIRAVYEELSRQTGVFIDAELAVSRLGPPLTWELEHWFPAEAVPEMFTRYRAMYPEIAIPRVLAMPGAAEVLTAARELGRAIVITAKAGDNAALHLDHLGLPYDAVIGDAWREQKAEVLVRESADTYIGDHVHDMDAARIAGVTGIAVPSGPCSAEELRDAGADHVVSDLAAVVSLLRGA
ncbi:HAD hydrolase-like protein [Aeromicrobium sp. 636]|uniref:HAD family hydrolase n=1 Tax=Aeromicrobium senzhongii TaxID=2663859 RepID=A0A8I0EVB9_9ACTN|nr:MULTISPECIES: HAD hydrolase-like protein [Aeromicrobium]MBC9227071.1 HAD family hydrolase [Aeromicrobium senzhongii]MCQ3999171.1 HAD hydrolase-like protein [Aeromicrobium sp. 636]MTB89329.1 HAD hydrolase-like protein [Aeromicrobium senzhongii]QNL94518.1 HAD family hydrolase [Aeromicrobium senzhongii]